MTAVAQAAPKIREGESFITFVLSFHAVEEENRDQGRPGSHGHKRRRIIPRWRVGLLYPCSSVAGFSSPIAPQCDPTRPSECVFLPLLTYDKNSPLNFRT